MAASSPPRKTILDAIKREDWTALREISLSPRGFEAARHEAWRFLLGVPARKVQEEASSMSTAESPNLEGDDPPEPLVHADERQVHLDADRSFVIYPELSEGDKERRKAQLERLIVLTLRKWPKLGYFQGYHDIISVFLLTFQPELTFTESPTSLHETQACVERMSLHRLRDSMGVGLAPLIGQLRILRRLLRLADPDFALILERTSPLPYFALSNLLTLFSHDIPTLPLAQHVFDYLLARPPIISMYLTASVIIVHKQDVLQLQTDDDDGMIHALLTKFPDITGDDPSSHPLSNTVQDSPSDFLFPGRSEQEEPTESVSDTRASLEGSAMRFAHPDDTLIESEESDDDATFVTADSPVPQPPFETNSRGTSDTMSKRSDSSSSIGSRLASPNKYSKASETSLSSLLCMADELYKSFPPLHTLREPDEEPSPTNASDAHAKSDTDQEETLPYPSQSSSPPTMQPPLSPSAPTQVQHIRIDDVFGPNSVMFTWSEDLSFMLSDDDAERLVGDGLQDVCCEYDGSSDRDLHEGDQEKAVVDHMEDDEKEEYHRRRERRRKEMIRSGVGLSVTVLVALSAIMLYGADRSRFGKDFIGNYADVSMLADWYQRGSWAAGFVAELGERVLGL